MHLLLVQLASEKSSSNMEPFPLSSSMHVNFEDTQAILEDYSDGVQHERGQLDPDEHQADPLDKASAYGLTNVPECMWPAYCCTEFDQNAPYTLCNTNSLCLQVMC